MILYHGTPITPTVVALSVLRNRHGLVSFARPDQIQLTAEVCASFVLDNGAFSAWKQGKPLKVQKYYGWVEQWRKHPGFDFALIPDVIDGTEEQNDALLKRWPFGVQGVPVWHFDETIDRLKALATSWPRVALGSSGIYATPGSKAWWPRLREAMDAISDSDGTLWCKLHGLRMLNPKILAAVPFSSADSTMIARTINRDEQWSGTYVPQSREVRARVLLDRIESGEPSRTWKRQEQQWKALL